MVRRQLKPSDYLGILQRRWWIILLPLLIMPVAAYFGSLSIPNRYTSQTLVLVEQQLVPDEFVRPIVTEALNMRLITMKEQILSRTRLEPIIERFGLYKDEMGKVPMEDIVDMVRKDIRVDPIHVEASARGGLPGFYIAFTADSPRLAQQVCSEITSMFMAENLKAREQIAEGTTDFMKSQLDDAKRTLDEQDAKLADFKRHYIGQLPEQAQSNLTLLTTMNTQLNAVTENLSRARSDKAYAESMLSQALANWKAAQTTDSPQTIDQQIAYFQAQLTALQTRYTDNHPDVIKMKNEIAKLQKKKEQQEHDAAKQPATAEAPASASDKRSAAEPQQIQQIRLQVHVLEQNINQLAAQQEHLQQQIKEYQAKVQLSPNVEEQYKQLTRDYDIARKFYDDLLAHKTQSEMATNLEKRQEGEQFRVWDPANLPEKPSSPNRPAITLAGLAAGFALGLGIVLLLELNDSSLRTDSDLKACMDLPILAMVPWAQEERTERRSGKRKKGHIVGKPEAEGRVAGPQAVNA